MHPIVQSLFRQTLQVGLAACSNLLFDNVDNIINISGIYTHPHAVTAGPASRCPHMYVC